MKCILLDSLLNEVAHFGNRFKTICAATNNNLEQDDDEC